MAQSQEDLREKVEAANAPTVEFVKDRPILGWKISESAFDDFPAFIRRNLGSKDETDYGAEYLERNRGSIVALQMSDDGPDFYIVGKSTYEGDYEDVPLSDVLEKNSELIGRLKTLPDLRERLDNEDPKLVGARKTESVQMVAMSDIGYDMAEEVAIAAPWGTQTKPAGQDAFLVVDASKDQFYLINVDEHGMPMGYARAC